MHGKSSERLAGLHKLWCIHTVPYLKYIMLSAFSPCSKRVCACICVCECVLCSQKKANYRTPKQHRERLLEVDYFTTHLFTFLCVIFPFLLLLLVRSLSIIFTLCLHVAFVLCPYSLFALCICIRCGSA